MFSLTGINFFIWTLKWSHVDTSVNVCDSNVSGIGSCSKLGRGSYLSYQDTFVWRTFLWNDSKNCGGSIPPSPLPSCTIMIQRAYLKEPDWIIESLKKVGQVFWLKFGEFDKLTFYLEFPYMLIYKTCQTFFCQIDYFADVSHQTL